MNSFARVAFCCFALVVALALPLAASAQRAAPSPQRIELQTKDGVQLSVTYYPSRAIGTAQAKQVTPVVLLHDFKDTQTIFASLAQRLQSAGSEQNTAAGAAPDPPAFAVVTVDLRGHGQSTRRTSAAGYEQELDPSRFEREHFVAMTILDMEQVRAFLVGKNDAGELNLNKLCLVGAGMGASVAVNWAARDWAMPPLAIGKQGQDVKGLVLISPRWSYQGLSMRDAMRLRPLKENVAWMLVYGEKDHKVTSDAQRILKQLERFHPEEGPTGADEPRDLVELAMPVSLQGTTLLAQLAEPVETAIVEFLTEHVAQKDMRWISRRDRLP